MKNIRIILNDNKTFLAENLDDVKILEDENKATTIEVQFPSDYANYSKRVDFLNIRNEKWTTSLYAPEDENNHYSASFDKLNFRFTIPSAMAKRGELQIQFIAYLADGTDTIVPFQVILATINKSIVYAVKEGRENPDLLIKAYEYSNTALEIARESFDKIENAERAALEAEASAEQAEKSAINAQNSANNAQNSANSANTRAINAENSARAAQESAAYAEEVSDNANTKSDNAVATSNSANQKSDNAVATANTALTNSQSAVNTSNSANTKATNSVNTANSANTKSDNAVAIATEAKEIASESNTIASTANAKSDSAVQTSTNANTKSDNAVSTANTANNKSDNAVKVANEAKTSATSAVTTSNSANTKSDNAVSTANSANSKSDSAVATANEALEIAEEALEQVVETMGTKVFIGSNTTPESNLNFTSNPQTQINNIVSNTITQANSSGGFGCGTGATKGTDLNFKGYTICDANGKIPVARLFDAIYPIGSIYLSVKSTNPGSIFGGTWVAWGAGRVPVGIGSNGETNYTTVEQTGGSENSVASHNHTQNAHTHSQNSHNHTQNSHRHKFNRGVANEWSSSVVSGANAGSRYLGWVEQGNGNGDSMQYISNKGYSPADYETATNIANTATNNNTTATNNSTGTTGGNRQPFITCYMWKRTA